MNNFRTTLPPQAGNIFITHEQKSMFIGSCFSQNIGNMFTRHGLPVLINPFGTVYNPFSIGETLDIIAEKREFKETMLHQYNDMWLSFDHNTLFQSDDKKKLLEQINRTTQVAHDFFKESTFLFITPGTSKVYEWKESGKIVSNCHKLPASLFRERLLRPAEITSRLSLTLQKIFDINPSINIIFSISPVRHLKDGFMGNQLSKSILFVALDDLTEQFKNISYFPAYEIMMDDLRDYRFYEPDMIHINNVAIDYLWEFFSNTFFNETTRQKNKDIYKKHLSQQHIPKNQYHEDIEK